MIQRTKQKLAFAVAASLSISGCLPAVRFRPSPEITVVQCPSPTMCRNAGEQQIPGLASAHSPFVRIVGESAPPASFAELELLAAELHSELAFRGGVQLEDSALVAQQLEESCDTSSGCLTSHLQDDISQLETAANQTQQAGNIKTMSAQMFDNVQPLVPYVDNSLTVTAPPMESQVFGSTTRASSPSSSFEISVVVNDFTPYRPMQLAATFVIRDLSTGQEIHRIQNVWRGVDHVPEFGDARKKRNIDLKQPATRQRLELNALPDISPRHLIKRAATDVADSLHQTVLKQRPPVSEQYSSVPLEFHPPQ